MGVFGSIGKAIGIGGPDPKDPNSQERQLAQQVNQRFDRSEEFFDPLQRRFDRRADDSRSNLLRGQANADTLQQLAGLNVDSNGDVREIAEPGADALTEGVRNASNTDANRILQQRSSALDARAGQGQSAIEGLSSAAETSTRRSLADLEQDKIQSEQRSKAFGQAFGAGLNSLSSGSSGDSFTLGGGKDQFGNIRPIGTDGRVTKTEPFTGQFSNSGSGGSGFSLSSLFGG